MVVEVPNIGEESMLATLKTEWQANTTLRLFQNDFVPDDASEKGDFTECTFSGYAGESLTAWGAITQNADNRAEMVHPEKTFNHDGGGTANNVYGWYVTNDNDADEVLFAERFPGGVRVLNDATDDIKITVTFTLGEG